MGKTKAAEKEPDNGVRSKKKSPVGRLLRAFLMIVVAVLVLTVVVNIVINRDFTVTFYQIDTIKVTDSVRIIELADLHNKEYGNKNEDLIRKIKALQPDLIFYAGDMMNYHDYNYSVLFDLSDKLSEIAPIYACYGNNELDHSLFEDKTFAEKFQSHNVRLLSNEAEEIEVGNTLIQLIAISDDLKQFDIETNNAKKFLESLEPTNACRICLTHYPELFHEKLLDRGIDVAFTGHAHGGLIRLPKIGGLYSTGEGFFPDFTAGVIQVKDGAQVVVSRGLGDSHWIPRINNQPELVVVDLNWY